MEKGREGGAPVTNVATGGASSNTTTNTTAATSFISTTKTPEVQVVEQPPKRRAGAPKRKANNSNTSGISSTPKRLAKERPSVPLPPNHNGPCTRARQSPNKLALAAAAAAAAAATSATGKPPGTGQSLVSTSSGEGAAEESNAAKEYWQDLEPLMDAEFEAVRSRDTNAHVVPTHAGWFSWTKIHPLEERSMPLFFNGKSEKRTPDIYLGIRNHIMKKFHADPQTPIELKDLSELSVGEPDARQEVMEFLDYWGLINFHPFPPSDSVMANAEVDAIVNTTTLLEKLYRFDTVQLLSPGPRADLSTPVVPPRLFPETAIVDDLVRPEGPSVEYHCNSCSADCSRKRYHCQKQADFDLCSECYNDGKFDSGMSPSDFILMEPAEAPGVSGGSWTDQETLLLLEALELYGENWNEIAEHVATKTKAQCILHFVQMPIEDIFLEHKENIDTGTQGNTNPDSVNDITSALKDAPEITESKASEEGKCVTNEDSIGAANEESKSTTNEENKSTANEESKSTANEESKSTPNVENKSTDNESKSAGKEEKSLSLVVDASKSKDEGQGKVDSDLDTNHALKALKEAFQAVSPLPECEGSLSFSDAGNPVMALVAFIARLVEPNVAAASTIRLLKTISEDSPAIQLATRNCFLLEDPPADDMKEPHVSESAVVEMVELEAQNKNQNVEEQGEEAHTSNVDGIDPSKDSSVQKIVNAVSKEESCAFPSEDLTEKPCVSKALEDVTTEERVTTNSQDKVSLSTQNEVGPITVKESHEPDNGDGKSDPMKDDLALPAEDPPSSVNKSVDEGAVVEATKCSEVTNAVDKKCEPIPSQEKEEKEKKASQPVASNSMVQSRAAEKTGDNTKLSDCKSENGRLMETKDQRYVDKVKRAAITAISAAGVKAKLLAKQEEDQIRQLTTFLIEKQVHKLETKLAFFSEMESMIVRVREQMDRSRQRLYQERAQIIAARLGLPASSSRTLPPSYPNNKIPIGYSNSVPKPLPGMNSSKSSVKRTMMPSAPLLSNSSIPSSVTGSLSHPSNQDKTSSVGTS